MFNFLSFGSSLLLALSVDAVIHGHGGRHAPSWGRSHPVVPRDGLSNDSPLVQGRTGQLARRAGKRCDPPPTPPSSSSSSSPPVLSPIHLVPGNVGGDPSSTPPAPTSTHHHHVAPVPEASPTSSAPPKQGPPKSGGSSPLLSGVKSGQGTFYGTGLDACGGTDQDSDMIAAASYRLFDIFPGATGNPNLNPICGRTVTASRGGKSVTVRIVDRCAGCEGMFDLDFSPAAFDALADPNLGRVDITWEWN